MRKLLPILVLFFVGTAWAQRNMSVCDKDNPSRCATVDAGGNISVTGGGGGTQYTEGDTDATITGSAIMWEDTSDTLRVVSAAKPLPCEIVAAINAGDNNIGNVDIVTFPDNEPFNVAQYGGSAVGTSNAIHVQPGTGAVFNLGSTDSTHLSEIEGAVEALELAKTTISSTDGLKVFLFDDNDAQMTSVPVTLSSFPDNEPFNLAQAAGATLVTGNGVTTSGSPRVTIASDNTPFGVNVYAGGTAIGQTSNALDVNIASGVTVDVAEGSTAGTYPALIGFRADTTENASVDDGDSVRAASDLKGRQIVHLHSVPELWIHANTLTLNATTEQDLIAADASYKICITGASVYNTDAANSEIVQVLDNGAIGTGAIMFHLAAPANGGESRIIDPPICTSAVNQKVTVDSTGSANPVAVSLNGFKTAE